MGDSLLLAHDFLDLKTVDKCMRLIPIIMVEPIEQKSTQHPLYPRSEQKAMGFDPPWDSIPCRFPVVVSGPRGNLDMEGNEDRDILDVVSST